jgi:hypothetical protein
VDRAEKWADQHGKNALIPHDIQSVARNQRDRTIRAGLSGVYRQLGDTGTTIDPEFKMSFIAW